MNRGEQTIDKKICSVCNEEKELSEFYSFVKQSKRKGEYIYYNPYCKRCASKKAYQWGRENKKRKYENDQKYVRTPKGIEVSRKRHKRFNEQGKRQEWLNNNKDKLIIYAKNHRTHNISEEEWVRCKKYFNNSCAYCDLTYEEHKELYNQDLHKEHVYHNGANDISNCIPACKSCNSQKSDYEFVEWFNEGNERFTTEKLNKIIKWLETDYK